LQVESIQALSIPQELTGTVETSIDHAWLSGLISCSDAELRASGSALKEAKTAYCPP